MSWSQGSWEQAGKKGNIGRVGIKGEDFPDFSDGELERNGEKSSPVGNETPLFNSINVSLSNESEGKAVIG